MRCLLLMSAALVACAGEIDDGPALDELAAVSSSKLGPHVMSDMTRGSVRAILETCPRVAKFLAGSGDTAAIDRYRAACPGGQVVVRIYRPPLDYLGVDPATGARWTPSDAAAHYWNGIKAEASRIGAGRIDWLEGPNEGESYAWAYGSAADAQAFADFWSILADRMHAAGFRPLVGSIGVGGPAQGDLPGAAACGNMRPLADMLRAKSYPIGWSYHAYSDATASDVGARPDRDAGMDPWTIFRYRIIVSDMAACTFGGVSHDIRGIPLVITEGGIDGVAGGWKNRGITASQYLGFLKRWDAELARDPDVVGATIWQVGNVTDWVAFDLTPLYSGLAMHLRGGSYPRGGWLDAGSGDVVTGWAFDPAAPGSIAVQLYEGTTPRGPQLTASRYHGGLVAHAVAADDYHGFEVSLSSLALPAGDHTLTARARAASGQWYALGGSRQVSALGAAYVSMSGVPSSVARGASFTVTLTMRNTGSETWRESTRHRLGSQSPQDNLTWGTGRILLGASEAIASGQQATFRAQLRAPPTAGSYGFQWRMVEDGVAWFGSATPGRTITVY